jgi:hypothetical protein
VQIGESAREQFVRGLVDVLIRQVECDFQLRLNGVHRIGTNGPEIAGDMIDPIS